MGLLRLLSLSYFYEMYVQELPLHRLLMEWQCFNSYRGIIFAERQLPKKRTGVNETTSTPVTVLNRLA